MNYYSIDGDFTSGLLSAFMEAAREFNGDEELTIYLSSNGGLEYVGAILTDFVNNWRRDVTIVASGDCSSAAFDLFMTSNSIKRVASSCTAIVHLSTAHVGTRELYKKDEETLSAMSDEKEMWEHSLETYKKIGMSGSQIRQIRSGKDCVLMTREFERLAENAQRKFYKKKEDANGRRVREHS